MKELAEVKAQLAECRRHSNNHRRSRDYHKEANARLREEVRIAYEDSTFEKNLRLKTEDKLEDKEAEISRWATALFMVGTYAIAMTVLFFWIVRQ